MIGAIIQARMTSSRLPGKVLMEIEGRPVLDYLYERLGRSARLQTVILATTTNKADDPLADYAIKHGWKYFRGSEQDVLARYYLAAKQFGVDHIMRITADCPLLDPAICDKLIDKFFQGKADYAHSSPEYAEGLDCEMFSFKALEIAYHEAKVMSEREHVTQYFQKHPEKFKKVVLQNETDDSSYRLTVDEPDDFRVVEAIISNLYHAGAGPFNAADIKSFLDQHPEIAGINSHIIRNEGLLKSLKNDQPI